MSAPVTNQAYSQQNNQLFDWAKTATPQQIEAAKQGLPKDSPLLLAIGMGVQYQQQARAPHPQAPQKTVMEQKLGEFAQTSPQGLPSVGGNQMAMQQVDPMRGAGIGVAPENTPAPQQAPQPQAPQQAATGGLVALAHGGEVRRFAVGGGPLSNLNIDPNDPNLENLFNEESAVADVAVANEALGGTPNTSSLQYGDNKYAKDRAAATHKNLLSEAKTKKQAPSEKGIGSLPVAKDQTSMAGLEKYLTPEGSKVDPNSYDADAIVANMLNKGTTPKYSEQPIGKHDILFAPADTSSAARNEAAPTAKGETYSSADTDAAIAEIARLRGPEADISEEVAAAKEATRSANKEKWGTALMQGLGGMLSAQTPYVGQALGAGLLSGVSGYQSGAKDEAAAEKEQRALQMAQKKANLAGHREATDIWLAQNAEQQKAEAAARVKAADLREARITALMTGKQSGEYSLTKEGMSNAAAVNLQGLNEASQMRLKEFDSFLKENRIDPTDRAGVITSALAFAGKTGASEEESKQLVDMYLKYLGPQASTNQSKPFTKLGNIGYTPPAQ